MTSSTSADEGVRKVDYRPEQQQQQQIRKVYTRELQGQRMVAGANVAICLRSLKSTRKLREREITMPSTGCCKEEMKIEIDMEEGEPLGATPNDKMIITKVQTGTISEGKLQIGDQVLRINDVVIKDNSHFYNLLRFAPPRASLLIFRDEKKAEEVNSRLNIPVDRERNITRRDGFSYELVTIAWKAGGPKLGLGIKHFQNRVLVSKTDPGTVSEAVLKIGDHIVDIDGQPVTDKDVARGILVKGLQAHGEVTVVIERPETMEAKHWTTKALAVQTQQPPSVQMNSDVRAIAQKERAQLAQKASRTIKSILGGQKRANPVQIDDKCGFV